MYKFPIRLDTLTDAQKFVNIATTINSKISITDGDSYTVNGKSLLGALCSLEFNDIFVISEEEVSDKFKEFLI